MKHFTIGQSQFKGLDTSLTPSKIANEDCQGSSGLLTDITGVLRQFGGYANPDNDIADESDFVRSMHLFEGKPQHQLIAEVGKYLFSSIDNGATWIEVTGSNIELMGGGGPYDLYDPYDSTMYLDFLYITKDSNYLRYYNGIKIKTSECPYKCKYIAKYGERLFIANSIKGAYILYWSRLEDDDGVAVAPWERNAWSALYSIQLTNYEPITGIISLQDEQLLITQKNHFWRLYGNTPDNYELREVKTTSGDSMGCINQKCLAIHEGVLFGIDEKCGWAYDGDTLRDITTPKVKRTFDTLIENNTGGQKQISLTSLSDFNTCSYTQLGYAHDILTDKVNAIGMYLSRASQVWIDSTALCEPKERIIDEDESTVAVTADSGTDRSIGIYLWGRGNRVEKLYIKYATIMAGVLHLEYRVKGQTTWIDTGQDLGGTGGSAEEVMFTFDPVLKNVGSFRLYGTINEEEEIDIYEIMVRQATSGDVQGILTTPEYILGNVEKWGQYFVDETVPDGTSLTKEFRCSVNGGTNWGTPPLGVDGNYATLDDTEWAKLTTGANRGLQFKFTFNRPLATASPVLETFLFTYWDEDFKNRLNAIVHDKRFWLIENEATTGVYQDVSFSVTSYPSGICWDGDNFWVVDKNTRTIYKYNSDGVYQDVSFSTEDQDVYPEGICWDGTSFWVVGNSTNSVYKYNSSGVYQEFFFYVGSQETSSSGICWDGFDFWVVGVNSDTAWKYKGSMGGKILVLDRADNWAYQKSYPSLFCSVVKDDTLYGGGAEDQKVYIINETNINEGTITKEHITKRYYSPDPRCNLGLRQFHIAVKEGTGAGTLTVEYSFDEGVTYTKIIDAKAIASGTDQYPISTWCPIGKMGSEVQFKISGSITYEILSWSCECEQLPVKAF